MSDLLLDRVIAAVGDRYEIEGELGRGGMAVVYRARDVRLRRPLALKVLPPDLAFRGNVRERFLREAQTAAQLSHPCIVPIYAADDVGGVAYLAMALVAGETLAARLYREPRPPLAVTRRVLAEVADALAYAHARGVVHRDVKPDNILLDRETGRAVVTDFGIARAAEADHRLTVTGVAVGTPAYMSPEQALGEHDVDGRSDIYSLGVVGYQMLAGATPFQGASAAALLMKHIGEQPRPLAEVRVGIPPGLAAAVERALAKKPAERWADATAFRDAILAAESALPDPDASTQALADPPPAPPATPARAVVPRPASPGPAAGPERGPNGAAPRPPARAADARPGRGGTDPALAEARRDWRKEQRAGREQMDAQRRDWRERERAQREAWREHWREIERSGLPAPVPMPGGAVPAYRRAPAAAPVTSEPIEHQATRFRRKAIGSAMLLAFLGVINLVTMAEGVPIPWVVFPAWGIIGGLRRRWRPLAAVGLRFRDVMFGREGGVGTPAHPAQAGQTGGPAVEALVRRLHRRVYMLVGSAVALAMTIALAAGVDDDLAGLFIVTIPLFVFSAIGTIRRARAVRRAGVGVRDAMSSRWRRAVALADRRPRAAILSEEVARLAAPEVAAGPHGDALRQAVDDRVTVRDTLNRLPPEDRALIPDVLPTVDALVDRVAGLAGSLHRIDSDLPPDMLDHIDRRLAAARAEPEGTPDRARKVQLLERQRASMTDLLDRRAALAAQMESAQLVLQNIKLDLLKLRSSGVGAAIDDVSSATQEARALSRDIQYALEAAAEVRRG